MAVPVGPDVARCIFRVRQIVPIAGPGPLTLLYPKWLPGYHAPASAIELMAGLEICAGGRQLDWRRHPVEVHAFHVERRREEPWILAYPMRKLEPTHLRGVQICAVAEFGSGRDEASASPEVHGRIDP